ncbi:MAG TPA: PAS domain-containing protein [Nevskiaceae bacterium]|nr:PAS domain-containing protein [Nevskiaceae bacterium]
MTFLASPAAEARFRALVGVTSAFVWVMTDEGVFREEQPSLQAFTGLSSDEIRETGWTRAVHPDDVDRVLAEWDVFQRQQVPAEIHYRMRRHDGVYRHMRARAVPRFDKDGKLREWVGANDDMTDYATAATELREREARLHQFAEALPHIAWEIDATGEIVWINRRFYEYTGLSTSERPGVSWNAAMNDEDGIPCRQSWERARQQGQRYRAEVRLRRVDGALRWFQIINEPQRTEDGGVFRWFGTATDIEDSHQAADKILRFLATLAHELRNPLAPIMNGVHVLEMDEAPDVARRASTKMIGRQAAHMVRLLDDLMDLNRVRSDKVTLRREPHALSALLHMAIETSRSELERGQHPLQLELPAEHLILEADATRITQVLSNVLNNAAKFSPEGAPIDVHVASEAGFGRIDVRDRGIGMTPEMLTGAFEMFSQADTTAAKPYGGLGIGLNVARRLIELHGGTIAASSDGPGCGTCITIRLPLAESRSTTASPPTIAHTPDTPSRRVLVVDDNRDAGQAVAVLLETFGHQVQMAASGFEALSVADRFRPEIVILDIGMPGMDGHEVCRRMRRTAWGSSAHLVALSGWGQESDRRQSLECGFDVHLVKPASVESLLREIARV